MSLPPVLREFSAAMIGLSALSAVYCAVMSVALHRVYPYTWPFFYPEKRFGDFTIYQARFELFHQATFFSSQGFPFTYPAPLAIVYEAFYKLGPGRDLDYFLWFMAFAFVVPAALFGRALVKRGLSVGAAISVAGAALLLSWPGWLLIDRANVEVVVWVAMAAGMWAYARNRDWTAAMLFGLAGSLKLFPLVYLALFLTRRGYRKLLLGVLTFVVATLGSLALLGPTFGEAYRGISAGLSYFHNTFMAAYLPDETGLDHSLLAFLKVITGAVTGEHSIYALQLLTNVYLPLSAVAGLVLYAAKIRTLPRPNQVLVLTIVAIFLTAFSGDGTLIHLYYPFALCCFLSIDAARQKIQVRGLRAMFFCFAYLFSTESFFVFYGYRYEGQAKCFVLAILLVCGLKYPLGTVRNAEDQLAFPDAAQIPVL